MAKQVTNDIKVVRKEGQEPEAVEIIEQSIVDIAKGFRRLNDSRIKREVIVTLVAWKAYTSKSDVERVLDCLVDLENLFLKPKKK